MRCALAALLRSRTKLRDFHLACFNRISMNASCSTETNREMLRGRCSGSRQYSYFEGKMTFSFYLRTRLSILNFKDATSI